METLILTPCRRMCSLSELMVGGSNTSCRPDRFHANFNCVTWTIISFTDLSICAPFQRASVASVLSYNQLNGPIDLTRLPQSMVELLLHENGMWKSVGFTADSHRASNPSSSRLTRSEGNRSAHSVDSIHKVRPVSGRGLSSFHGKRYVKSDK